MLRYEAVKMRRRGSKTITIEIIAKFRCVEDAMDFVATKANRMRTFSGESKFLIELNDLVTDTTVHAMDV